LPNEKPAPKDLKVTDKRIFTPEGELREELKSDIQPSAPQAQEATPPPAAPLPDPPQREHEPVPEPMSEPMSEPRTERRQAERRQPQPRPESRRRSLADKAANPGTPFTNFVEQLIAQAYMSLGLLRNPYEPETKVDAVAARQMIEILSVLKEKTQGNLDPDEEDFLDTHLGELKLAFVQRTKTI
jgi:hypothetical protein